MPPNPAISEKYTVPVRNTVLPAPAATPAAVPSAVPASGTTQGGGDLYGDACSAAVTFKEIPFFRGVASLCQPALERRSLDEEIKLLEDGEDESEKSIRRLAVLKTLRQDLKDLDQFIGDGAPVKRAEFAQLAGVARKKILALASNPGTTNLGLSSEYREAKEIQETLRQYQALEQRALFFLSKTDQAYPPDFPLPYRLEFGPADQDAIGRYGADVNKLKAQGFFALFAELKASEDPEKRNLAAVIEKMVRFFAEKKGTFQGDPRKLFGGPASLDQLKAAVKELKEVVGDPRIGGFFDDADIRDVSELKNDEGFKARMELQESIAALKTFDEVLKFSGDLSAEGLNNLKTLLLKRGDVMRARLVADIEAARRANESKRPMITPQGQRYQSHGCDDNEYPDPNWKSPEEIAARERLAAFDAKMAEIRGASTTAALKALTKDFFSREERLTQDLLLAMDRKVRQIPSYDDYLHPNAPKQYLTREAILDSFFNTAEDVDAMKRYVAGQGPAPYPTLERRIQGYVQVAEMIQKTAMLRTVEARILMYIEQSENARPKDQWLANPMPGMGDSLVGRVERVVPYFDDVIARYKKIGEMLNSKDPAVYAEGCKEFMKLEGAPIRGDLEKMHGSAQRFNFISSVGIMVAASFFGAGLGGLARILVAGTGGARVAAAAAFAGNVIGFTASHELLTALIFKPESLGEFGSLVAAAFENPSEKMGPLIKRLGKMGMNFGVDCLLNAGMMKFIGWSGAVYERLCTKAVLKGIELRIPKTIAVFDSAAGRTVQIANPAYQQAVEKEMANLGSRLLAGEETNFFKNPSARNAGAALWEGGAFVPWDIVPTTVHAMQAGGHDLSDLPAVAGAAIKNAFNAGEVGEGFLFLIAMKMGTALAHPLTKAMNADVSRIVLGKLQGRMDAFQAKWDGLQKRTAEFFAKEEGDIGSLIQEQMELLKEQQAIIDQIPVEYRHPDVQNLNNEARNTITLNPGGAVTIALGPRQSVLNFDPSLGVRPSQKRPDQYFYRADQQSGLVQALKALPNFQGVEFGENGLVTARFKDAFGEETALRFRRARNVR